MNQLNCVDCGEPISGDRDFGVYARGTELRVSHLKCFIDKAQKLSFFRRFNLEKLTLTPPDEKKMKNTRIYIIGALISIAGIYMLMANFEGLLDPILISINIAALLLIAGISSWLMTRNFKRLAVKWQIVEEYLGPEEEM